MAGDGKIKGKGGRVLSDVAVKLLVLQGKRRRKEVILPLY